MIHHSATGEFHQGRRVDRSMIDKWHRARRFGALAPDGRTYHIGYHYLILPDGTVERGRPEAVRGAHARGHNDTLGVCLVGSFDRLDNRLGRKGPLCPSPAQLRALDGLTARLMERYRLGPGDVYLHRDVVPTTRCPGDCFPRDEVYAGLIGRWLLRP